MAPDHVEMASGPNDTIPPTPYAAGAIPGTWPPPPPGMYMPQMNNPGMPQMMPMGATPPMGVAVPPATGSESSLRGQRESWERQQILQALEKTSGNQKEAALLLGVSRRTLINKIEAYGIARPRKKT